MPIKTKRIYEPAEEGDGVRILVDRLWPRGIKKDAFDLWMKDVAPSNDLRKWFHHEDRKWSEFRTRYRRELAANKTALAQLRTAIKGKTVTLLYGAKDEQHNQAVVLAAFLKSARLRKAPAKKKKKKAAPKRP
jgi:DNA-3-methyladenine glycosylase